ncbi:ATP-binding cassette domain-containing protein [Alicyclobacillus sp. SO9]|uniref:ATP-binding cassette domain-containing protein n=1 Tax=Alicyclobacillus sp. SO9 TaxID=2665646 RepID=UPI0018E8C980|nr:ATP-binding cassette domain-containing protein [Alicyclobacillus sp. SO9]QQE78702.1 ATP-binding cassette domain-containing protein [Alicyclobacillus sp. SO9]
MSLLRNHIGYVFQNYALIDDATVDDNLDISLMYNRAAKRDKLALKQSALAQVELPDIDVSRKIYTLSGEEQQRVALARLLLKPCDLILADEPTGSLDADNRAGVIRILKQLHQDGRTIIVVTHDEVVANACDRAVGLSSVST